MRGGGGLPRNQHFAIFKNILLFSKNKGKQAASVENARTCLACLTHLTTCSFRVCLDFHLFALTNQA